MRGRRLVPTLLVAALAAGVFWGAEVKVDPNCTVGRAAAPWTDGAEYLDGAVVLARSGRHAIHVSGELHPSRYPFGFSLVTAAFIRSGVDPAWAPYRANQLAGALLLTWTLVFWWRRIGPAAASLAALLLACLPAFVILCRSPLSEIWGTTLAAAGIWWLHAYACGAARSRGIAGTALLTASLWFRTSNALLAPFVAAAWLARHGLPLRRGSARSAALRDGFAFVGAALASLTPLWLANWRSLGNPLATGYGYWAPYWNAERAFDWQFVGPRLTYYGRELLQTESLFTTANLYGHGSYVGPAFVVLAVLAAVGVLLASPSQRAPGKRRRQALFGAAAAVYLAAMTAYFFSDARLLFPLFVLAAPVVATACVALWRSRTALRRAAAVVFTAVIVAAVVGWPPPAVGGAREPNRSGWSETLSFVAPGPSEPGAAYRLTRQLGRIRDAAPRLVLTDVTPPYVHALMPSGTWVAPLGDDHLFRFNPEVFVFGAAERAHLMARALEEGRTVWALEHRGDVRDIGSTVPPPPGFVWELVTRDLRGAGLARLVAASR